MEVGESRSVDGIVDADDNATYHEKRVNNVGSPTTNIDYIDNLKGNDLIKGCEFVAYHDGPELNAVVNSEVIPVVNEKEDNITKSLNVTMEVEIGESRSVDGVVDVQCLDTYHEKQVNNVVSPTTNCMKGKGLGMRNIRKDSDAVNAMWDSYMVERKPRVERKKDQPIQAARGLIRGISVEILVEY
eukprot:GHVR01080743.1.p1 GENE.GHVR01080743.1~~GHVR01080743.1.p1  ORF type:complete len:212 (+),score=40.12 GHVR01080743.1:81-638(+)